MSLTRSQRTRLILTTRKLGAMLGETPTVTISASSTSTLSHSEHSNRSLSPPRISITLPSQLPSSPTDSTLQTPLSPTFDPRNIDTILSPSSPTYDDSNSRRMRRKRIAKLTRTFGENVPPELLMSHPRAEQLNDNIDKSCETSSLMGCDFLDYKSDTDSLSSSLSFISFSGAYLPRQRRFSYMSYESNTPLTWSRRPSLDVSGRGTEGELAFRHSYATEGRSQHSTLDTHPRKQSWIGEWNHNDMEAVQNKLRKLK